MESSVSTRLEPITRWETPGGRRSWMKFLILISIIILGVDTVYRSYYGITYLTREECFLYRYLSRFEFLIYEYFVELVVVVIVGVYIAALLEKHFLKYRKYIPRSPIAAFFYASAIPVCSCGVIPLIKSLDGKIPFRTIMTFLIAAPLLNPYIVVLSVSVIGYHYAILRIVCSLVLAVSAGYTVELFYLRMKKERESISETCRSGTGCTNAVNDVYESTFATLRKILPFLLFAALFGVVFESAVPEELLSFYDLSNSLLGTALVILVGVPLYFCNGADVLFLQPLIYHTGLPLGTAMAFSLTSTSICISSLALLYGYIGKKLTFIMLACVVVITFLLSFLINLL